MKTFFLLFSLFLLANSVFANHESVVPTYDELDYKYQNFARGKGIIGPPYQETFEYLLVFEPGWLHFVFSHPLDPSQAFEVEAYQAKHHLNWNICCLEIAGQTWTAISMPVENNPRFLAVSFLNHIKKLSFFVNFN